MSQKLSLLFALGVLLASQAAPAGLRYESKHLGLIFQHPQDFLVGRPVEAPLSKVDKGSLPSAEESLIERRFLAGQDLNVLRRDSPQILLSRHRGTEAEFDRKFLMKDSFRQQIGAWEVYVLPGAPAPYGDKAFYYLIPLKDQGQSVLEISAPRSDLEDKPTHYDRVIRGLIESLEVVR